MTPTQRMEFKLQLEALASELSGRAPERLEPNRTSDSQVGDDEDEQPLNEMLQTIASNRNRANVGIYVRVTHALRRLTEEPEEFGLCLECGEDLPLGRLRAMPYAEYCVECQTRRDEARGGSRKKLTDYR